MVIIVNGSNDFNDYNIFKTYINECVSFMKPYDNELTIFSIAPENIFNLIETLYAENINQEIIKNKRIKFYKMSKNQYENADKNFYQFYLFLANDISKIEFINKKVNLNNE